MGEVASFVFAWLDASWIVLQSSSLWLLLGFFLAGLINVYLPQETIKSHLKGGGLKAVVKASAIGVPLPLCSCSVIPVAVSLRKSGASRGATASFLVSTPEIGVDSFLLSSGLLGLPFACLRAFAAFVSAFTVGVLIDHFPEKTPVVQPDASGACGHCCQSATSIPAEKKSLARAFRYGFVELFDDIAKSLLFGILASALITVLVPPGYFTDAGLSGLTAMFAMLLVALPTYVCATASTPLAGALLAKGMEPGAVLVFLLAGPASNIATMFVVKQQLGARALAIYLGGLGVVSMLFGFFAGGILPHSGLGSISNGAHEHVGSAATAASCAIVLMFLLYFKKLLVRKKSS